MKMYRLKGNEEESRFVVCKRSSIDCFLDGKNLTEDHTSYSFSFVPKGHGSSTTGGVSKGAV